MEPSLDVSSVCKELGLLSLRGIQLSLDHPCTVPDGVRKGMLCDGLQDARATHSRR